MQFGRLEPGEIISLLLAALAGGAMYAIVVTSPPLPQGKHITVLAAASMQNAFDDVNAAFTKSTDIKVIAGYAASSALIKQIAQGAAADVFASANLEWWFQGRRRNTQITDPGYFSSLLRSRRDRPRRRRATEERDELAALIKKMHPKLL